MPRRVSLYSSAANHAFGSYENLLLAVFRGAFTPQDPVAYSKLARELNQTHPGGVVIFSVYEQGVPTPDAESKRIVGETMKQIRLAASAHVIEGEDLKATALRMGVSAFALISPSKAPSKVTATVSTAASWLSATVFSGKLTTLELTSVMEEVRSAVHARPR